MSSSELQPRLARRLGERADATMIKEAVSIEDHVLDALLEAYLRDRFSNLLGLLGFVAVRVDALGERGRGDQGIARHIVDQLSIDMIVAAIDRETRPLGGPADFGPDALLATKSILEILHGRPYFLPDLPAFWRMRSPVYRTPLPV